MTATVERVRSKTALSPDRNPVNWWVVALVALLGLVVGLVAGYWAWGGDADQVDPAIVLASDQDELSERQLEMVEVMDDYVAAWMNGDGDAAAALVTSDFVLSYPLQWVTMTTNGGAFQRHVGAAWPDMVVGDLVFVGDNTLVVSGQVSPTDTGPGWTLYAQFTTSGDVLITRHIAVTR